MPIPKQVGEIRVIAEIPEQQTTGIARFPDATTSPLCFCHHTDYDIGINETLEIKLCDTDMNMNFPDDADGDALRRIAESGNDLNRPMDVDIQIAAPDEEIAFQIANAAGALGYRTEVYFDDDIEDVDDSSEPWTCECSKVMVLTYEGILAAQEALDEVAKPLSGYVDGWATLGNTDLS